MKLALLLLLAATAVGLPEVQTAEAPPRCITTSEFAGFFYPPVHLVETVPLASERGRALVAGRNVGEAGDRTVSVFLSENGETIAGVWNGRCVDISVGPFSPVDDRDEGQPQTTVVDGGLPSKAIDPSERE